jgi:hypothetical protein
MFAPTALDSGFPGTGGVAVGEVPTYLSRRVPELLAWQSNAVQRSHHFSRERCLDRLAAVVSELVEDWTHARSRAANTPECWVGLISGTTVSGPAPQAVSAPSS